MHRCSIVEASESVVEGDGLWTTSPGLRIGLRVADCVPVLLAGRSWMNTWVAALHAGWRGPRVMVIRSLVVASCAAAWPSTEPWGCSGDLVWPLVPPSWLPLRGGRGSHRGRRQDPAGRSLRTQGRHQIPLGPAWFLRAQALDLGLDSARDGSVALCTVFARPALFLSSR